MNTKTAHRGFTLVELMIALLIGLFLIGGLKRTNTTQSGLSQLQDNERVTMTLITDVVQSTGYFPNPLVNSAASEFLVAAPFTIAGEALVGSGNWGDPAPGNTITVRYATAGGDGVINCSGATSAVQRR